MSGQSKDNVLTASDSYFVSCSGPGNAANNMCTFVEAVNTSSVNPGLT